MTKLQWQAAGIVAGGLALWGLYAGWRHEVQVRAVAAYAVADDVTVIHRLTTRADSLQAVFRVDTVRLTKWLARWDTLRVGIDTLLQHDTVTVPVEVVRTIIASADTTIRECHSVLSTCEQGWLTAKQQVLTLQTALAKTQQLQPSVLMPRFGFGVAAGVNPQGKVDAVAGLTFSWKLP